MKVYQKIEQVLKQAETLEQEVDKDSQLWYLLRYLYMLLELKTILEKEYNENNSYP